MSKAEDKQVLYREPGHKFKLPSRLFVFLFVLFSVASVASLASAAVPQFVNYQSRLRDAGGTAITATTTIQFSIYNDATSGTPTSTESSAGPLLWKETYNQATGTCAFIDPDSEGYFTVQLGTCNAFPGYLDFTSDTLYVGVKIESDSEATPRARLGTAPYAFNAEHFGDLATSSFVRSDEADTISASSTDSLLTLVQSGIGKILSIFDGATEIFTIQDGGNVGIGTSTPATLFTVATTINIFNVLSSGNVGIGTASPATNLHIKTTSGAERLTIETSAGSTNEGSLDLVSGGTGTRLFYRDSDDEFGIWHKATWSGSALSGGTTRFRIESDGTILLNEGGGNVGIGTTVPGGPLHVQFGSTSTPVIFESTVSGGAETVVLDLQGPTIGNTDVSINFGLEAGGSLTVPAVENFRSLARIVGSQVSAAGMHLQFQTKNDESDNLSTRMHIDRAGNVGIGTVGPNAKLHVEGTESTADGFAAAIQLENTASGGAPWYLRAGATGTQTPAGGFSIADANEYRLVIDSAGNVGIGTSTPSYLLEVFSSTLGITNLATLAAEDAIAIGVDGEQDASIKFFDDDAESSQHFKITFNAGTEDLRFQSDQTDNILYLDNGGNVGIGDTTPDAKLDVAGDIVLGLTTGANEIAFADGTSNQVSFATSGFTAPTSDAGWKLKLWDNSPTLSNTYGFGIDSGTLWMQTGQNRIEFWESGSEVVVIDNGNMGIGTSTPTTKLVLSDTGDATLTIEADSDNSVESDNATLLLTQDGNSVNGLFGTNGNAGIRYTGALTNAVFIEAKDTSVNSLQFVTGGSTIGGTDGTVRMTILGTGNVGIGTTVQDRELWVVGSRSTTNIVDIINESTGSSAQGLHIQIGPNSNPGISNNFIFFKDGDGTNIGEIEGDGAGGITYKTTSDMRLKENIVDTAYTLEDLLAVQVRDFNFIDGPGPTTTGFIAQELNSIYAPAVSVGNTGETWDGDDDLWSLDYGRITPLIIVGVQDLNLNLEEIASTTASSTSESRSFAANFFSNLFNKITDWFADATNGIRDFFAQRIHTKEICLGEGGNETCINKDQLDALLRNAVSGGGGGTEPATTTPVVDTGIAMPEDDQPLAETPEPTPEVTEPEVIEKQPEELVEEPLVEPVEEVVDLEATEISTEEELEPPVQEPEPQPESGPLPTETPEPTPTPTPEPELSV